MFGAIPPLPPIISSIFTAQEWKAFYQGEAAHNIDDNLWLAYSGPKNIWTGLPLTIYDTENLAYTEIHYLKWDSALLLAIFANKVIENRRKDNRSIILPSLRDQGWKGYCIDGSKAHYRIFDELQQL